MQMEDVYECHVCYMVLLCYVQFIKINAQKVFILTNEQTNKEKCEACVHRICTLCRHSG